MKKLKKGIIYSVVALLLVFSMLVMSGCGVVLMRSFIKKSDADTAETEKNVETTQSRQQTVKPTEQTSRSTETSAVTETPDNNIGNYYVGVVSSRLGKDYDDNDVIVVKFVFVNNDDEAVSFSYAFDCCAYQNGIELDEALGYNDSQGIPYTERYKDIKKGARIEVEIAYELRDLSGSVEVEVSSFEYDLKDNKVTRVFRFQ